MEHLIMHENETLDPTVEVPPSPTGLYPGPIWATGAALAADDANEPEPEIPPSATGLYPGPIWAEASALDADVGVAPETAASELGLQEIYRIVRVCGEGISGDDLYASVAGDQGESTGLAFGMSHFTQASGMLGRVLAKMRERDAALFSQCFGSDADALLATTNASTPAARLAPVGGMPLWSATWRDRFRLAGAFPECQAAQNEVAIEEQFRPMLPTVMAHGLVTDRALAVAYDLVATYGFDDGLRRILEAIGPMPGTASTLVERIIAACDDPVRARLERLRASKDLDDISYRRL
jgi:hypothetical protein